MQIAKNRVIDMLMFIWIEMRLVVGILEIALILLDVLVNLAFLVDDKPLGSES